MKPLSRFSIIKSFLIYKNFLLLASGMILLSCASRPVIGRRVSSIQPSAEISTLERNMYHHEYRKKEIFQMDQRATGVTGIYVPLYIKAFP